MNKKASKILSTAFLKYRSIQNKSSLKRVFSLKDFQKLWVGQIFSQLADKFYIVLIVYLIDSGTLGVTDTDKNLLILGILIANCIPAIFLGTLAGVWVDRLPKKPVLISSNLLRAILLIITPFLLINSNSFIFNYIALIMMTLLESILTQFFAPAEQASIPILVQRKDLMAANSVYQATSMGSTILGFAIGFLILSWLKNSSLSVGSIEGEFLMLPFCYGLSALSLSRIELEELTPIKKSQSNILKEINHTLQILRQNQKARKSILQIVFLYSLLGSLTILSLSIASSIESLGRMGFGSLLAMTGIGMVCGAGLVAQTGHVFKKNLIVSSGLGIITLSLLLLSYTGGSLKFTLISCSLLGIGASLVAIPAQTILQEDTPASQHGKVFGIQNNLVNIFLSVPLVISGFLVSIYGIVPVLWGLAVLALIAAVLETPWKSC